MKRVFLVVTGMMAAVALASPRTISINFGAGYYSGSTVTGVYGIEPSEHWQNLSGQSGERHDVEASDGSKCSVSWSCTGLYGDRSRAKDAALKAYLDDHGAITISVSNIPFAEYHVIVYQSTDATTSFAPPKINGVYYSGNGNVSTQWDTELLVYGDSRVLSAGVGVNSILVPKVFSGNLMITGGKWIAHPARDCIAAIQLIEGFDPSKKYEEEIVDGVKWCYSTTNGVSTVEGCGSTGKRHEYTGDLIVPNTLGGLPVVGIGNMAFLSCSNLHSVVVAEGAADIGMMAFSGCMSLRRVKLPASIEYISPSAFGSGNVVVSLAQPNKRYASTADGIIDRLTGKSVFAKAASVEVLSTTVRKNDPTIIDVEYKVTGNFDTVDVRPLAFLDGTISWSNVVRPETFVADTNGCASVIGDGVTCGEVHHFSWNVSADYADILAKFKLQMYVRPCELLHLDLMRIPAREGCQACEFSINELKQEDVMNVLYWLYAVKSDGFTLLNGELRYNNIVVARQASLCDVYDYTLRYHYYPGISAIFNKMGYSDLKGDTLSYVNDVSRLKLTLGGFRQYAFKWLVK